MISHGRSPADAAQDPSAGPATASEPSRSPLDGALGDELYQGLTDVCNGVAGRWNMRRDARSGACWLDPQPTPEEIPGLYVEYATHERRAPKPLSRSKRLKLARKDAVLASWFGYRHHTPSWAGSWAGRLLGLLPGTRAAALRSVNWLCGPQGSGRLLDVGCGNGDLLGVMARVGWQVQGVEFDPVAAEVARKAGHDVLCGSLESAHYPDGHFEAVILSHVIEHLPDPRATLAECFRVLAPGGQIVLTTPNLDSHGHRRFGAAWRGLEVPRHLVLFTPRALSELVAEIGFGAIEVATEARTARWIYCLGRQVEDGQVPLLEVGEKFSGGRKVLGRLFQTRESLAARFWPVGEELRLRARRP